jgi:hypothetical protein
MKLRIALLAAVAMAASAPQAFAATAQATVSATLVNPGSVSATRALAFGTIIKPTSGTNTVTVASAASGTATPTLSGGGNASIATSGQASAATFNLVGVPSGTYSVAATNLTFTNNDGSLTSVGAEAPTVQSGTFNSGTGNGTLPAGGTDNMFVGGHFTISNTATPQAYTGTLEITVNFN